MSSGSMGQKMSQTFRQLSFTRTQRKTAIAVQNRSGPFTANPAVFRNEGLQLALYLIPQFNVTF